MSDLANNCLRCGAPIEQDADGIDGLCWPPGCADYFVRHLFSRATQRRREKRDQDRLAAWRVNST